MGESSGCSMVRSYSQPISYRNEEEHHLRALTSSVSFGRFVSDSLDWEKWSCFTQNRCLEEVQKLSKPGSVAAMKAHFEAHYKKIANKKAVEVSPGQENKVPNDSLDPNVMNKIHNSSLMDSDSVKLNRDVSFDGTIGREMSRNEVVLASDANCRIVSAENEIEAAPKGAEAATEEFFTQENSTNIDYLNQLGSVEKHSKVRLAQEKKTPSKEGAELATEKLVSDENSTYVGSPNILGNAPKHSKIKRTQEKKTPSKKNTDMRDLKSSSTRKSAISLSKSSFCSGDSKLRAPVQPTVLVHPRKENNATLNSKKTAGDFSDKKQATPESLRKSISFASCAAEGNKKSSPILDRIRNSKIVKSFTKLSKDSSSKQVSTKASSLQGVTRHNTEIPQQENMRSNVLLDRSSCSSRIAEGKSQSLSTEKCVESPSARGRKTQSPTVFSSFSFHSEERAARRKEKVENTLKMMEPEKAQVQAKSKIPHAWSHSPKLGNNLPSSHIQDTISSRPPRRSSWKTDAPNRVPEKNKQIPTHSISSRPKKNARENASA